MDNVEELLTEKEQLIKEAQGYWRDDLEIPLDLAVRLMEVGIILDEI